MEEVPKTNLERFVWGIAFHTAQSYESLLKSIHKGGQNAPYLAWVIANKLVAANRINATPDVNREKQWRPRRSFCHECLWPAKKEEPVQLSPVMTIKTVSRDRTVARATFLDGRIRIEADAKIVFVVSLVSGVDIITSAVSPLLKLEPVTIDNNIMIRDCLTKITTPDELVTGLLDHMKFLSGVESLQGEAFLPGTGRHHSVELNQ